MGSHVVLPVGILLLGLVFGAYLRGWLLFPSDRRRIELLAERIAAEQQIQAMTQQTLQQMRAVARDHRRRS